MTSSTLRTVRMRPGTESFYREAVERVVLTIRSRLGDCITLDDMAAIAHLSPFHFSRVFRQVTGVPPIHFLHSCRLERAKELLLSSDQSIINICLDVGYASLGTFTSRFTKLVGLSPRQFRRASREAPGAQLQYLSEYFPDREVLPVHQGQVRLAGSSGKFLVAVAVFRSGVPECDPIDCTLTHSSTFRLGWLPDGSYQACALAFGDRVTVRDSLQGVGALQGRSAPVTIRGGELDGSLDVFLRAPALTDPPLLWARPALVLSSWGV